MANVNDPVVYFTLPQSSGMTFKVSSNNSYNFGFTGFNVSQPTDDFDEFEDFVRDVRKGAGIVDRPKEKRIVSPDPYAPVGQILWSGRMTLSAPNTTKGMIYGITGGFNDIKK